jgi:hypothetical protein
MTSGHVLSPVAPELSGAALIQAGIGVDIPSG